MQDSGYKNKIKISVIVPVYNTEKYIACCLDSIINQTFKDIEIICVNDDSTDNSLEILNEYAWRDCRIKVISQKNQGQGVARNNAINISVGKYIVFLDSDDFLELNALEIIYSKLKETNAEVLHFDYTAFSDLSKRKKLYSFKKRAAKKLGFKLKSEGFYNWRNFKSPNRLVYYPHMAWNKAYSAEFIKNNKIKFSSLKNGREDQIFSSMCQLLADNDNIYYIAKSLYNYRIRSGSSSKKVSDENFSVFEDIQMLKDFLTEKDDLYKDLIIDFREYVTNVLSWTYPCIPHQSTERYLNNCRKILTEKEYKRFLLKIQHKEKSFLENIFSIKNGVKNGKKYKIATVFGIELNFNKPA